MEDCWEEFVMGKGGAWNVPDILYTLIWVV